MKLILKNLNQAIELKKRHITLKFSFCPFLPIFAHVCPFLPIWAKPKFAGTLGNGQKKGDDPPFEILVGSYMDSIEKRILNQRNLG